MMQILGSLGDGSRETAQTSCKHDRMWRRIGAARGRDPLIVHRRVFTFSTFPVLAQPVLSHRRRTTDPVQRVSKHFCFPFSRARPGLVPLKLQTEQLVFSSHPSGSADFTSASQGCGSKDVVHLLNSPGTSQGCSDRPHPPT